MILHLIILPVSKVNHPFTLFLHNFDAFQERITGNNHDTDFSEFLSGYYQNNGLLRSSFNFIGQLSPWGKHSVVDKIPGLLTAHLADFFLNRLRRTSHESLPLAIDTAWSPIRSSQKLLLRRSSRHEGLVKPAGDNSKDYALASLISASFPDDLTGQSVTKARTVRSWSVDSTLIYCIKTGYATSKSSSNWTRNIFIFSSYPNLPET